MHRKSVDSERAHRCAAQADPQGLVDAVQPLAAEEHQEIQKRKALQLQRLAGKKPAVQFVKKYVGNDAAENPGLVAASPGCSLVA